MTLIRQVWLMLFGVLLFALVGSLATHALVARQSLRAQLQARNDDDAMMLALALSQQQGDAARMQLVAAAQADARPYRRLRLLREDGSLIFELDRPELPDRGATLVRAAAAVARGAWAGRGVGRRAAGGSVADCGALPIGRSMRCGPAACAWPAGWRRWAVIAGAMAALAMRAWRRPLDATVAQAQALQERRFRDCGRAPSCPSCVCLTRAMNSLVRRLQGVFEHQAATLEEMRQQAHADAVTGLTQRRHFLAQLDNALRAETHRGAGLLLVRLRHLDAMNRRIGHEATDRLLAALAQVLQSYPRHVQGALTGRLNGADFALYLPASGMAEESAALAAASAARGAVDGGPRGRPGRRRRRAAAAVRCGGCAVAGRRCAGTGRIGGRVCDVHGADPTGRRAQREAKASGRPDWRLPCASVAHG